MKPVKPIPAYTDWNDEDVINRIRSSSFNMALTDGQRKTLHRRAARILKAKTCFLSEDQAEDLAQEAIKKTGEGTRRRKPGIDLVHHLTWAMHSMADGWCKKARRCVPLSSSLESKNGAQSRIADKLFLEKLGRTLRGDTVAKAVFDLLPFGYRPAEIQKQLKIDARVYRAAYKRIVSCGKRLLSPQGRKPAERD